MPNEDCRRVRAAQCELDDIAPHFDLRRRPRYQYYAVVAAYSQVRLHAAGGGGPGLRQPVHAEDLAIGAISAASSPAAINKFYSLPGAETLSYREMIGRIFDGLEMPRRTVSVPPLLWRAVFALAKSLYPGANVAMGIRMMKDMTFDSTPAVQRLRLESESLQSQVQIDTRQSMNTTVLRPLRITRSSR